MPSFTDYFLGCFSLDDYQSNTTIQDYSIYAATGALNGGLNTVAASAPGPSSNLPRSIAFDGTDDFIDTTVGSGLRDGVSNNFSIFTWFFLSGGGRNDMILWKTADGTDDLSIYTRDNGGNTNLTFTVYQNGAFIGSVDDTTVNLQTGVWYHGGCVKNGNTTTLYLNGNGIASGTLAYTLTNWDTNRIWLGSNHTNFSPLAGFDLNGRMAQSIFTRKPFNIHEVRFLYNYGSGVPFDRLNLILDQPLQDNAANNKYYDVSATHNTGTSTSNSSTYITTAGPGNYLPLALNANALNSSTDIVSLNQNISLNPTGVYTVEFFAKRLHVNSVQAITDTSVDLSFIGFTTADTLFIQDASESQFSLALSGVDTTKWHHYAIAFLSGGATNVYVDSLLKGQIIANGTRDVVTIGKLGNNITLGYSFPGYLAGFKVYNSTGTFMEYDASLGGIYFADANYYPNKFFPKKFYAGKFWPGDLDVYYTSQPSVGGGTGSTYQKDSDFSIFLPFDKNTITLSNKDYSITISGLSKNIGLQNLLFNGNISYDKNLNALINNNYNIGLSGSSNNIGLTNKLFSSNISNLFSNIGLTNPTFGNNIIQTNNTVGQINKNYGSLIDYSRNLNAQTNPTGFNATLNYLESLIAQTNPILSNNFSTFNNNIGLINRDYSVGIGLLYDLLSVGVALKDFDFGLTLSLIRNLLATVDKSFAVNNNLTKNILGLENFTFNDIIYVPSTKIGIENNNFTITWPYAGTNLAQTSKTLGIDSRYLTNLNMTTDKTYGINYTLLKSLLVQKNPDFGVVFNETLQKNCLTKQDLPISIPLSHDEVKNLLKNYSFPLILDLDYDIATQAGSVVILDILGVDDNFWCIIKEIKNWVSTKDIQNSVSIGDLQQSLSKQATNTNIPSKTIVIDISTK